MSAFEQFKKLVTETFWLTDNGSITFGDKTVQTTAFHGYGGAFSDYTTQSAATTTNSYVFAIGQTDWSNGVSITNGGKITFGKSGIYNIQWSGQFENSDVAAQDIYVWYRKNGTDVTGTTGIIAIPSKHGGVNGHLITGWNFIENLNANDYIELVWGTSSTAVTLVTSAAGTNPTRPSTASLIVTATKVR